MNGKFSVWNNNALEQRSDLEAAHNEIFEPLVEAFSKSGARVRLEGSGTSFNIAAAELEGFLRPLWGIVPYICGGGDFQYADLYRKGLVNGCNPDHQDFWGVPDAFNQILVDVAAIAFALCLTKSTFWDPLNLKEREIVAAYLFKARNQEYPHNNWKFFKVLVDTALEIVGYQVETDSTKSFLDDIESFYLGDGWYGDGYNHRIDYYNPFALHFYGLIYVKLKSKVDPDRCSRFIDRANKFACQYVHWFSDDGASLPYGRSLIYRFSVVGFWGMYASVIDKNEEPAVPWGVIKGIYLNNLRWWAKNPILNFNCKILSLGYSYPNNFMTERYNSPQSPYWCTKAFSALFMDSSHPFWKSEVQPLNLQTKYLDVIGMHMSHQKSNTIALVNGPWHDYFQPEKYSKFAYSTRYGFGVITNHRSFLLAHLDNMIGFSFNNKEFSIREEYQAFVTDDDKMVSKWTPLEGIEVESWMIPKSGYHIRTHYVKNNTGREVFTKEGGFAVPINRKKTIIKTVKNHKAEVITEDDYSVIIDLSNTRTFEVCQPEPNSNVLYSRVLLPQLSGIVKPKTECVFSCVVCAYPLTNEPIELDIDSNSAEYKNLRFCGQNLTRVKCNT